MLTIRKAILRDVDPLSELACRTYVDAFGHSFLPADLKNHLEGHLSPENIRRILEKDTVLLAEIDHQTVGFCQFGQATECPDADLDSDGVIERLYVLKEYQNQGIGSSLMKAALDQMRQENVTRVLLDVWEHNPAAIRFYQRFGFEVVGRHKFEVASGAETSDDLVMVCSL
jgi:ribosomal protein S18 acetylase RimI-like enzyme